MTSIDTPRTEAIADDALLLHLGERIDAAINARVHALRARVLAERPYWLRDVVPAYASIAVFFDAACVEADTVHAWLQRCAADAASEAAPELTPRIIEIPVRYGGEDGPDLQASASELDISPAQLIERHAAGDYTVVMIGFAPGFPYLLGLDPALALPRLATPRTRVPAGSVGIGGAQTGLYPRESPGGWRLIGRTPLKLFDPTQEPPALLAPGDRVRFVALDGPQ